MIPNCLHYIIIKMGAPTEQAAGDFVFRSKLPDIHIPNHLPLHSYCFQNISQLRDRPCLINGSDDRIYTYAEVELTCRRVASGLHKQGINRGDTVMILLPNSPEYIFTFLGASYGGAIATMANPMFTPAEVVKQVKASNARLIVTQASNVNKVKEYAGEREIRVVCTDAAVDGCLHFSELAGADEGEAPAAEVDPEDVVALPYSSGTTGLPKGVMLTHKGLVTSVAQHVEGENPHFYLHGEDALLCVLPFFHIYSMSIFLCGLRVGAQILIMQRFEIAPFFELIQKYKVTVTPLVPPIVLAIAKSPLVDDYDLSSVRVVMSGAAPLGKELQDTLREKFSNARFGQGYGMTEGGSVLAMGLAFAKEPFEIKSGSVGTVVRNAELKIVDPETGSSLPRNQPGEICIRGHQIMKGYLNDEEATKITIDKEGWLHTGDVGYIDEDDELFIVDRLKELIKYKGFQVAPAELEALLLTHPLISDAAVIPMKDEDAGEVPVAFVVKLNGCNITEDDVKDFVSKQVIFYKRIRNVFFVEAVPKSPSGKILRKNLRARLEAQ
ncbi:unnamed protein product [Cuscuta campestris]|uniref:4-coumarate--CoA ligase n=1 Tax=Cuscuta campestris TaxID=132261 RepID=A0A484KUJ7_9ASTE|nr:unnamed protein product [Cuscuta campestris]